MQKVEKSITAGRVIWLGVAGPGEQTTTAATDIKVFVGLGIQGDRHAGSRIADVRDTAMTNFGLKGAEVPNMRHFSAVSVEELAEIQTEMGLSSRIPFGCLGENLVIEGIPNLTQLPPGTLLFFQKDEKTTRHAVLAVWAENMPCHIPGEVIGRRFSNQHLVKLFPGAALHRRGVVGFVFCSGKISVGDIITACIPPQQLYLQE